MSDVTLPALVLCFLVILSVVGGVALLMFVIVSVLECFRHFAPHQNVNVTIDDTVCFEDVRSLKFLSDRKVSFSCSAGDIVIAYSKIRVDTVTFSWFGRLKGEVRK